MGNTLKLISGFILVAAAGTAAGILLAPERGSKTRKKLRKEADEAYNIARKNFNEAVDDITKKSMTSLKNMKESVKMN